MMPKGFEIGERTVRFFGALMIEAEEAMRGMKWWIPACAGITRKEGRAGV